MAPHTPKLIFNLVDKTLNIEDISNYTGFNIAPGDVQITYKVTAPNGQVIYINDGFDDGLFTFPDINVGLNTVLEGIELPTDAEGKVITGNYKVNANVLVSNNLISLPITGLTSPNDGTGVVVLGQFKHLFDSNLLNPDAIVSSVNMDNTGIEMISAEETDVGGGNIITSFRWATTMVNDGQPANLGPSAELQFNFNQKTENLEFIEAMNISIPCPKIESSVFCHGISQMNLSCTPEVVIGSTSDTYAWEVEYPDKLLPAQPNIITSEPTFTISPIATGKWLVNLIRTIVWEVSETVLVNAPIVLQDVPVVNCAKDICSFQKAYHSLVCKYIDSVNGKNNPIAAGSLQVQVLKVGSLIGDYLLAERCGNVSDMEKIGGLIADELTSCGCDTTCDTGIPEWVPKLIDGVTFGLLSKDHFSITEFARDEALDVLTDGKGFFVVPYEWDGKKLKRLKVTIPTAATGSEVLAKLRVNGISQVEIIVPDGESVLNIASLGVLLANGDIIDVVVNQVGSGTTGLGLNVIGSVE